MRYSTIKKLCLLAMLLFSLASCSSNKTYEDYTSILKPVTYAGIFEKEQSKDNYTIYIGRKSCPGCREFVKILYNVVKENELDIYYWNIEGIDKKSKEYLFLKTLGITTIPSLLVFDGNNYHTLTKQKEVMNEKKLESLILFQ